MKRSCSRMSLSSLFALAWTGALTLAMAATARADLFDFSYSFSGYPGGPPVSASGTLTAALDPSAGAGAYLITGITGTRTYNGETDTITGLEAPGGFGSNDNLIFPGLNLFTDDSSFSYTINSSSNGDSGNEVNVYHSYKGYSELGHFRFGSFTFTPATSSVPEPGAYALLASLGLSGAALLRRRKRAR